MNKKVIAKTLNLFGILMMLAVMIMTVPFLVPKLLGYQLYGVLSESMTPAYSVGGVVYVKECDPNIISEGDVITFKTKSSSDVVMTHRVVEKNSEERYYITKGDANNTVDAEPVEFQRLIGKVTYYLPYASNLATWIHSVTGKATFVIIFAISFIFWLIADLLMPEKEKKRKKWNKAIVIRNAGIFLILVSAIYLAVVGFGYYQSGSEYDALNEIIVENETENIKTEDKAEGLAASDLKILEEVQNLHKENPELIGWILFDDMDISYPIMQGSDNSYYLDHTYSGTKNSAGSIFMEAANQADFSDSHTIIYGHNMKNLSMFGSLRNYRKDDFYEGHQFFTIYSLEDVYRYQIFAYYDVPMDSDLYTVGYLHNEQFEEFIGKMLQRSYKDTGVEVEKEDKIITLSTCSAKGQRFVLNGKRIK